MLMLEEIFKHQKAQYSASFNLRFQRALSWLKKSVDLEDAPDLKLMSLWVALQALHAENHQHASQSFEVFLQRIYHADQAGRIGGLMWDKLQQPIVWLVHRPYLYAEFWQYQHQQMSQQQWKSYFNDEKQQIEESVQQHQTLAILRRVFHCLNTLHQQMSQGGICYQSAIYQPYIQQSCRILSELLLSFMYILLEQQGHSQTEKPFYPAIQVC